MDSSDFDTASLRSGFIIGLLLVAAVALVITLAVGVDTAIAVVVAIGLGLVVGGPIGALLAARMSALKK